MFYSHTFLARKGPLGTVWVAAHLQHKLKKSQITSTNILTTVERILVPEVPIALRLSGHLLLGVVRIYSKQVEYFVQDCINLRTVILKASFSTNVNLPEDATHAPYHSITLPETFELDAVAFDEDLDLNRFVDTHLKSHEEITLEDPLAMPEDQYVAIFIAEDMDVNSSKPGEASGLGAMPMDTDSDPTNPDGNSRQAQESSPKNQEGVDRGNVGDAIPQETPEMEIMRDAPHDHSFENVPIWPGQGNIDVMEPDKVLEEQIMKDKGTASPVVEEMLASGGNSPPSQRRQEPSSATSAEAHEFANPQISFGHQSPDLALVSTPPPLGPRQTRKRKLRIDDKKIVLTNGEMKEALQDPSKYKRKRAKAPSSLSFWKLRGRQRGDQMLLEPLITGLCDDLCNIYKADFISANVKMASSHEDYAEPSANHSPPSGNDLTMEIERLRDNQDLASTSLLTEILPSTNRVISSPPTSMPSPVRRDDFTPATTTFGTESGQMGRTMESEVLPTPDPAASTSRHAGSDMETPSTWNFEGPNLENTVLSDIPEVDKSAGDLFFLDQDDDSTIGLRGTPEVGYASSKQGDTPEFNTLSARTRAVAQYLKGQSPVSPISEESGDLNLNTILEGKNKKICARMFFETLVLKNCGLVDTYQSEPYGDITLQVTSKLKEQFSS